MEIGLAPAAVVVAFPVSAWPAMALSSTQPFLALL
jgi:hypothetical protein